jgi:hypothetical protein
MSFCCLYFLVFNVIIKRAGDVNNLSRLCGKRNIYSLSFKSCRAYHKKQAMCREGVTCGVHFKTCKIGCRTVSNQNLLKPGGKYVSHLLKHSVDCILLVCFI